MTRFEWLPNEILLELFQYFHDVELFSIFYELNSRLNQLLTIHSRVYHFDFRSISKQTFHKLCEEYFPLFIHRIKSFYLSNDDQTPNLFHSYYFKFNQFISLQILSLNSIDCLLTLNKILFECRYLSNLQQLSLFQCNFKDQNQFYILIENIWNLPKLISCKIDHQFPYELKLIHEKLICSNIENLSLENFQFDLDDLTNLFRYTPFLRQLNLSIIQRLQSDQFHLNHSSLISLKISFRKSFDSIFNLFKNFSYLKRLTIQTSRLYLTGNDWKKIIENNLVKLEKFQLKMKMKYSHPKHIEEQLNELIQSFQTRFWIQDKQWFVQCDWFQFGITNLAILYTLPYTFDHYLLTNKYWSKSTSLQKLSYDYVHNLTIMNMNSKIPNFRNLVHLKLDLPLGNQFWSSICLFNRLNSLEITFVEDSMYLVLQNLFNRSPCLQSVCFGKCFDIEILSKLTSQSIHRLDFLTKNLYKKSFNKFQCKILSQSSLGYQCKYLLISIENRMTLLYLLKNMLNLRSLICQCKDDKLDDEFLDWLRRHLPLTYFIQRDINQISNIRLWIH